MRCGSLPASRRRRLQPSSLSSLSPPHILAGISQESEPSPNAAHNSRSGVNFSPDFSRSHCVCQGYTSGLLVRSANAKDLFAVEGPWGNSLLLSPILDRSEIITLRARTSTLNAEDFDYFLCKFFALPFICTFNPLVPAVIEPGDILGRNVYTSLNITHPQKIFFVLWTRPE